MDKFILRWRKPESGVCKRLSCSSVDLEFSKAYHYLGKGGEHNAS